MYTKLTTHNKTWHDIEILCKGLIVFLFIIKVVCIKILNELFERCYNSLILSFTASYCLWIDFLVSLCLDKSAYTYCNCFEAPESLYFLLLVKDYKWCYPLRPQIQLPLLMVSWKFSSRNSFDPCCCYSDVLLLRLLKYLCALLTTHALLSFLSREILIWAFERWWEI